jgi:hypothetical protein
MRLPWRREARQINTRPFSTKALELETAKEILSEVFHARPADVEEMIQRRLVERNCHEERKDDAQDLDSKPGCDASNALESHTASVLRELVASQDAEPSVCFATRFCAAPWA